MLFRFRFQLDDSREKRAFIDSLSLDWEPVSDFERTEVAESLASSTPGLRRVDEETWYKVDWEKVPELIERRSVYLKKGKAYVPGREQLSMIMAEFTARLERALEVCLHGWIERWIADYDLAHEPCSPPVGRG
jgi:DNA primase large subunit